jgi:primosomal protein N'
MTWGDFVPDRAINPPEADGWRAGDCPDCDGEGTVKCPDCDGLGKYTNDDGEWEECWECKPHGSGRVKCDTCDGDGWVDEFYDGVDPADDCYGEY